MLSTAESLVGLSRHLSAYAMGPQRAALGQLEFAGNLLDVAMRLRGSGVSPWQRVLAMSLDAGVDKRRLQNDLLPTLETLGLVEVQRAQDTSVAFVSERLPPLSALLAMADSFLSMAMPEPVELAVLAILNATTVMPLTIDTASAVGAGVSSEEDSALAIEHLEALHLCSRQQSADGPTVLYNPNVWAADRDHSAAAVRAEDGKVRAELSGLIEEVAGSAGLPQDAVTSTDQKWVDYAVAKGLLQRSVVVTTDGQQKAFLFTPHMARSAFSEATGVDPSGHVRQLIGSMVYARNYANFKLWSPVLFLNRLIRDGEAGDASSIATDYPMLELAGIMKVEPASRYSKLVLLQSDVAEQAVDYLQDPGTSEGSLTGLRDQRRWEHPERQRARIAREPDISPASTERLLASLRQVVAGRGF